MFFEHVINTGGSNVYGKVSGVRGNNEKAEISNNTVIIEDSRITQNFETLFSVNTQTLVESTFTKVVLPSTNIYEASGDYFVDEAEFEVAGLIRFSDNFPQLPTDYSSVSYDKRTQETPAIYIATNTGTVSTGLMHSISGSMPSRLFNLSSLMFFANGQKLYSGQSYSINPSDDLFQYSGAFTGKFFAIPKETTSLFLTGASKDLYGQQFLSNRNNIYCEGMEQQKSKFLEIHTGVTLIEPQIDSTSNFNNSRTLSYSL